MRHECAVCKGFASWGVGSWVDALGRERGRWYCSAHRPADYWSAGIDKPSDAGEMETAQVEAPAGRREPGSRGNPAPTGQGTLL